MYFASIAAPPRIGCASPAVAAAGAAPPRPSLAARTSAFVTRPCGPVPLTEARSTPSAVAARRATGEALTPSVAGAGAAGPAAAGVAAAGASGAGALAVEPAVV